MAKIRVYELARDLNLENKILLSKLNDLDIAVKSHMSALDDDTVAQIRQQLFGKKEETIEETRVRPTVRRWCGDASVCCPGQMAMIWLGS